MRCHRSCNEAGGQRKVQSLEHSGQHVRQLVMVLEMLGIEPDRPPTKETFAGLPMPDKVWDDERVIA